MLSLRFYLKYVVKLINLLCDVHELYHCTFHRFRVQNVVKIKIVISACIVRTDAKQPDCVLVDFDKRCIGIAKRKFTEFHDITKKDTNGANHPPRPYNWDQEQQCNYTKTWFSHRDIQEQGPFSYCLSHYDISDTEQIHLYRSDAAAWPSDLPRRPSLERHL